MEGQHLNLYKLHFYLVRHCHDNTLTFLVSTEINKTMPTTHSFGKSSLEHCTHIKPELTRNGAFR